MVGMEAVRQQHGAGGRADRGCLPWGDRHQHLRAGRSSVLPADVVATGIAAQLIIVGGTDEQVSELRKLVAQHRAENTIRLVGRVPQAIAREYNNRADVLVSPRVDGTNTPLKIYEQLATGKPLVATNIYSHTQVLNDSVCFLVPPSRSGMAEGLESALTSIPLIESKVKNAKKMYAESYSRPVYEQKLRQIYKLIA